MNKRKKPKKHHQDFAVILEAMSLKKIKTGIINCFNNGSEQRKIATSLAKDKKLSPAYNILFISNEEFIKSFVLINIYAHKKAGESIPKNIYLDIAMLFYNHEEKTELARRFVIEMYKQTTFTIGEPNNPEKAERVKHFFLKRLQKTRWKTYYNLKNRSIYTDLSKQKKKFTNSQSAIKLNEYSNILQLNFNLKRTVGNYLIFLDLMTKDQIASS